jgi:hypothetical protein
MARSKAPRRPFWLIVKQENDQVGVLNLDPGREVLPVFSYEEEAEIFLWLGRPKTMDWQARKITTGGLASLLGEPFADVRKVALDPLPTIGGKTIVDLMNLEREDFVRNLIGEQERRETQEEKRMQEEAAAQHEEIPDDADIPDYVMSDSGPPEESRDDHDARRRPQDSGHGLTGYGEGRE